MRFLVDALCLHIVELAVDILLQVLLLDADPLIAVQSCRFKSVTDLIFRELSVLSECVQADDVLHLLCSEGLCGDLRPLARIVGVLLIIGLALLFTLLFFLFVLTLLFLLLLQPLSNTQRVANAIVVGLNTQARLVLKSDCHVRTEAGNLEEVDALLTHDFIDDHMRQLFLGNDLALFVQLVFEDVESEALLLSKDLVYEELVLFIRMREEHNLLPSLINVSSIIITVFDSFLGCDQLADVDSTGVTELLQVVGQVLQVVTQVLSLSKLLLEDPLDLLNFILQLLALHLLSVQLSARFSVLIFLQKHDGVGLGDVVLSALSLRVVEEPLGKEVDWILGVGFVHNGHALGDDHAQVFAFEVLCVCDVIDHLDAAV